MIIDQTITINAHTGEVWKTLTKPDMMLQWMGDTELQLEIHSSWQEGSPLIIRGFHHTAFENKGTIWKYEPGTRFTYNQLSSLSRLTDVPEHYSVFDFQLTALQSQTLLQLTITNFPTETIFQHLNFYWNTTLHKIKSVAEKQVQQAIQ